MKGDSSSKKLGEKKIKVVEFTTCNIEGRVDFDCTNS